MCGIICEFNKEGQGANEFCVDQYEEQYMRGSKGFGVVIINEDKSHKVLRATEGAKFMYDLHSSPATSMMVHHRMPTSSPNYLGQTHPILVDNESLKHKYLVIHNGIINNDDKLKEEHEKMGYEYTTAIQVQKYYGTQWEEKYNDSEAIAIELARFIEKKSTKIGAIGSAAVVALQIDKETDKVIKVFFGRNFSNPLCMTFAEGKLRLSSEGEGEDIKPDTLYSWNFEGAKLKKRAMEFATAAITYGKPEIGFKNYNNGTDSHNHTGLSHLPVVADKDNWETDEEGYKHWWDKEEAKDAKIALLSDSQLIDSPLDDDEQLEMIVDEGRSELDMYVDEFYVQLMQDPTQELEVEGLATLIASILKNTAKNVADYHLDKELAASQGELIFNQ